MSPRPAAGEPAPDFRLASTAGEIALAEVLAESPVLLVFYPGDRTPVCTRQLCDYRDNLADLGALGVRVLAVNPQPLDSHQDFARRHDFGFPLASDPDGRVCRAYGALGWLGTARRTLVLVGRDGRIAWRDDALPVFYRDAAQVRAAIRAHLGSA